MKQQTALSMPACALIHYNIEFKARANPAQITM